MKRIIRVSDSLTLPIDAVTQTMAAIARKGAGKTYLAKKLAEQMLSAHAQIVVLDVVGNWFGLRISSDAKHPAFEIYVFGGDHGDVPLTPDSGKRIAALIVEKNIPVVLDISSFRKGERERFAAEFAEEFFHRKKTQRSPVHLFIEEAQKLIPQMAGPEERKMLGAFEDIVRLGRNYGIGCTLISQRPQSVNKEVLSQVECLFALQVNGVHERKALEAWVTEHGAERHLVGQLPGLRTGEAFVWSPAWLRIFEKVRIGKIETLDTSATPEVGTKLLRGELSPVDVEALKAEMAEVVAKAEADDPKVLRRRIDELERGAAKAAPMIDPAKLQAEFQRGIEKGFTDGFSAGIQKVIAVVREIKQPSVERSLLESTKIASSAAPALVVQPPGLASNVSTEDTNLTRAERLILRAIAWIGKSTKSQASLLSGYSIKSSSFANALSTLRTSGFIVGPGEQISITERGSAALGPMEPMPKGGELVEWWVSKLDKAPATFLRIVAKAHSISKADLSLASGYSITSSSFANGLSTLRSMKLLHGTDPVELAEELK